MTSPLRNLSPRSDVHHPRLPQLLRNLRDIGTDFYSLRFRGDEMNDERSYFERSQGATTFDPELQFEADLEAIIRASREKSYEQKED